MQLTFLYFVRKILDAEIVSNFHWNVAGYWMLMKPIYFENWKKNLMDIVYGNQFWMNFMKDHTISEELQWPCHQLHSGVFGHFQKPVSFLIIECPNSDNSVLVWYFLLLLKNALLLERPLFQKFFLFFRHYLHALLRVMN